MSTSCLTASYLDFIVAEFDTRHAIPHRCVTLHFSCRYFHSRCAFKYMAVTFWVAQGPGVVRPIDQPALHPED